MAQEVKGKRIRRSLENSEHQILGTKSKGLVVGEGGRLQRKKLAELAGWGQRKE